MILKKLQKYYTFVLSNVNIKLAEVVGTIHIQNIRILYSTRNAFFPTLQDKQYTVKKYFEFTILSTFIEKN